MHVRSSVLWMACLALAAGPACAQTAAGAAGSNQTIPEKEAVPPSPEKSNSDVKSGRSLSQKLDASGGVIKPSGNIDPGIKQTAPVPEPNSMPVITPLGMPGGPPGPEAK